ncbi:MAG TPA: DinB family protein [Chitinophagaceae bacterium]|nr:DinB family protein [Chitinophagaceae bacterium]
MKELLQQYATYNTWANQKLGDLILSLPPEMQIAEIASSFRSIHHTLLHMLDAESIWWQRIKLQENVIPPSSNFNGDTKELYQLLLQQNKFYEEWVASSSEMALEHVFKYYNTKREPFKVPTFQVLLQIFNHGSYHRGQLVTMLRQLGQTKIPQTDFIVWSRRK